MKKTLTILATVAVLSLGLTACDKTTSVCEDDTLKMSMTDGKGGGKSRSGSQSRSSSGGSKSGKSGRGSSNSKKHHDFDDFDDCDD